MNNISWRDNGILFSLLGGVVFTLVVGAEMYIQGLTAASDTTSILVEANNEADRVENIESSVQLSTSEIALAETIAAQILTESETTETAFSWKSARSQFPQATPNLWLEVAEILYEHQHFEICHTIYHNLLENTDPPQSTISEDVKEEALFQLARISSQENREDQAISYYRQLLASNPHHQATLINLGIILSQQNQHTAAVEILDHAIETTSGSRKAKALSVKASSLIALDDPQTAEATFQQSILYRPQNAPTWRKLAEAKMAIGSSPEEILQALTQAISLQKNYEQALYDRARYYWKIGDLSNARSDLETIRDNIPEYIPAIWTLSHLYIATNKNISARNEIENLLNIDLSAEDKTFAEALLSLLDNDDSSDAALERLNSIEEDEPWLVYYRAVALSRTASQPDDSANSEELTEDSDAPLGPTGQFDEALALLTSLEDDYWLGEISQLQKVELLRQQQQYQPAIDLLSALHQQYPDSILFAQQLGTTYLDQGQVELAIPILQQAIAMTSDNRQLRFNLARALARHQQTDEAVATYEQLLNDHPSYPIAHYHYALLLEQLEQTDDAVDHYQQVIEYDPGHLDAQYRLSEIYFRQQRFEETVTLLENLLAEDANHRSARELLIRTFQSEQNWELANQEMERLLSLEPNNVAALMLKFNLLSEQERLRDAAEVLLALPQDAPTETTADLLFAIGNRAVASDDPQLAQQCLLAGLSLDPTNLAALIELTDLYHQAGEFSKVVEITDTYPELAGKSEKITIHLAEAHYSRGNHKMVYELLQPLAEGEDSQYSAEAVQILEKNQSAWRVAASEPKVVAE